MGYSEAPPGGEFLKIGIGTLRKLSEEPYNRFRLYPIVNGGERELLVDPDRLTFRHHLLSNSFGYEYHKTIRLYDDRPCLRLEYQLRNLGAGTLIGEVYNHNFFTIDRMRTGPDTLIRFPFHPAGTWRQLYDAVALTGDGIAFQRRLHAEEVVFMGDLHGHDPAMDGYAFTLANRRTGAMLSVSAHGCSLSHLVFWACAATPCLEPYTPLCIFPGETRLWSIDYTFSEP